MDLEWGIPSGKIHPGMPTMIPIVLSITKQSYFPNVRVI